MRMRYTHPHLYFKSIQLDYAGAHGTLTRQGRLL